MGSSESKKSEESDEARVLDPFLIQWDANGHLRYGEAHKVDPGRQLVEIMELDYVDDVEGRKWYLIETAWLTAWLAYVHHDKDIAPAPGPCRNDRLIQWDILQNKYVGRPGLIMSSRNCAGDFRRISRETWQKFKEFYPESGPTITLEFSSTMLSAEETNIGQHFVVLDPPPAPVVTVSKTLKKKAIKAAKAEEADRAAAEAAAKIKEELAKPPPAHVYLPDEEHESKASQSDASERDRGFSMNSSFSTVSGVGVRNEPKVVSNLPNQPRNPMAEQFALRAVEAAQGDANRASERASFASGNSSGAARHNQSFSGVQGLPPQMQPPRTASMSAMGSDKSPVAGVAPATKPSQGSTVHDMYYAKD